MFYLHLKIKVIYLHRWFHKEHLTSLESFSCTKGSLQWKMFFRLLKMFLTQRKKELITKRFFGETKTVSLRKKKKLLEPLFLRVYGKRAKLIAFIATCFYS